MPLGGYCEVCDRWVWVERSGDCQFGHAAVHVRDVQPLEPRGWRGRLPTRTVAEVASSRGAGRWWWRHSLWMVWTLTFGFLNWFAFFYIGLRARYRPWIAWGFVYLIPVLVTFATIGTSYLGFALAFQFLVAAVSFLHAASLRTLYRGMMVGALPSGPPSAPFLWTGQDRPALPPGVDEVTVETLREAQARVDEITAAAETIAKPAVRGNINRLRGTAEKILDELHRQPSQVPLARSFLVYYLDAANRIVRGYAELSRPGFGSPEVTETLAQAEGSLEGIQAAFDNQLAGLMQHRLLDLDTEIALLERTVQSDHRLALPPAAQKTDS